MKKAKTLSKSRRQAKILELINQNEIGNQKELMDFLKQEGIRTTQSTVSRDLKELQLFKVPADDGGTVFKFASNVNEVVEEEPVDLEYLNRIEIIFKETVIDIVSNNFLIVIKTLPGMAQAAAHAIDTIGFEQILGTIAGDDTIFVAIRNNSDLGFILNKFRSLMEKN